MGEAFAAEEVIERMMGNVNIARMVVTSFLEYMPPQLVALADALAQADAEATASAAHAIKGAAGNAGAITIQAIASQMEHLSYAGDIDPNRSLLEQMKEEFASVAEPMQSFCSLR